MGCDIARPVVAAHGRADAVPQAEGLDEIVVGARIETCNATFDTIARGDDEYRSSSTATAIAAKESDSVRFRQAKIEQHQVIDIVMKGQLGFASVTCPINRISCMAHRGDTGLTVIVSCKVAGHSDESKKYLVDEATQM
jgi:hypothetical protein